MANYDNIPSIAVIYEGTIAAFDSITDKSAYYNSVVFITGNQNSEKVEDKKQAIWVSSANGANPHYLNMADANTVAGQLSYIKGIMVNGTTYPTAPGGAVLAIEGDGVTIEVNTDDASVTINASGIKKTAEDAATAAEEANTSIANLISGDDGKTIRQIATEEAEAVGASVTTTLIGSDVDGINAYTIKGIKNSYVSKTFLIDGSTEKIKLSLLPDAILGQLQFGGTIGNSSPVATSRTIVVTPSANYKNTFDTTVDEFTISEKTESFAPENKQGWYFIVAKPNSNSVGSFGWGEKTLGDMKTYDEFFEIGDWFISNGVNWIKIDNTDSVTMVAGMQGNITTSSLVTELSTADDENLDPLAKKSDIKISNIQTIAEIDDVQTRPYFIANRESDEDPKELTITATVRSMNKISKTTSEQGFADARDVYDFIKARLSIKVVK